MSAAHDPAPAPVARAPRDRRRRRARRLGPALDLLLEGARRSGLGSALALVDDAGLVVAGAGLAREVDALAAESRAGRRPEALTMALSSGEALGLTLVVTPRGRATLAEVERLAASAARILEAGATARATVGDRRRLAR